MKAPVAESADGIERLMDVTQVAEHLGVSRATVWRMRRDGTFIPPVMLGKYTRWRVADFNRWIVAKQQQKQQQQKRKP